MIVATIAEALVLILVLVLSSLFCSPVLLGVSNTAQDETPRAGIASSRV